MSKLGKRAWALWWAEKMRLCKWTQWAHLCFLPRFPQWIWELEPASWALGRVRSDTESSTSVPPLAAIPVTFSAHSLHQAGRWQCGNVSMGTWLNLRKFWPPVTAAHGQSDKSPKHCLSAMSRWVSTDSVLHVYRYLGLTSVSEKWPWSVLCLHGSGIRAGLGWLR